MANKPEINEKFKTTIGGQALIEGIMMRGPEKQSIVVRSPEGLVVKTEDLKLVAKKHPILGWPLIRGVVNFGASMINGIKALMYSADFFPEMEAEPSKFDLWLEKKLGSEKMEKAVIYIALVFGIAFSVGLFVLLPTLLAGIIPGIKGHDVLHSLVEGTLKIVIFLSYLALVSRMRDMKRVFSYHGAEHKTIRCYEAMLPLTVDNVRVQTRKHPRCGTSFLLVVVCISILCGVFIRSENMLIRMGLHLLLLPLIVAVSYEINRFVGRHDNWFTRILTAPGQWMQNFTTYEPDDEMIEVAIKALEEVIPAQEGDDQW